jgi:hypothetical protein
MGQDTRKHCFRQQLSADVYLKGMEIFGRCALDLNAMLIIGTAPLIKLPGFSVGLLSVPDTDVPATMAK